MMKTQEQIMNSGNVCFVIGGRLGDFIHMLYVVKCIVNNKNAARVYITDRIEYGGDGFSNGLLQTYTELCPVIKTYCPYVKSYEMLGQNDSLPFQYINMNTWRASNLLYKADWLTLLSSHYNIPNTPDNWMSSLAETNTHLSETIIVHHSTVRFNPGFPWEEILSCNKCIFVTSNVDEYNMFPYKHYLSLHSVQSLEQLTRLIDGCKFFIGNQSSPAAFAVALGKPCLLSLTYPDCSGYMQDSFCNNQCYWFLTNQCCRLPSSSIHFNTKHSTSSFCNTLKML